MNGVKFADMFRIILLGSCVATSSLLSLIYFSSWWSIRTYDTRTMAPFFPFLGDRVGCWEWGYEVC